MNYITDINSREFDGFIQHINKADILSLDIEANSLDPITGTLLLIQAKVDGNIYIFDARQLGEKAVTYLVELINNTDALKLFHNASFDVRYLRNKTGIMLRNFYCSLLGEAILTGGEERYSSLDKLVKKYVSESIELNKEIRKEFHGLKDDEPITQDMLIYSAEDVNHLEEIFTKQIEIIRAEKMVDVLELELELLPVVVAMTDNGVKLDKERWTKLANESLEEKIRLEKLVKETIFETIRNQYEEFRIQAIPEEDPIWDKLLKKSKQYKSLDGIYDHINYGDILLVDNAYLLFEYMLMPAKSLKRIKQLMEIPIENIDFVSGLFYDVFNVDSPYQLVRALYVCGVFVDNAQEDSLVRARNAASTTEKQKELLEAILKFKEYSKRVSSFGLNFLEHIHPVTGRIHADVYQIGTVSGRFAYNTPNLQQIPGDKEYRMCFIAPDGSKIITSDYSQQELRLAGDMSEDEVIILAYKNDEDIHKITGGAIYEIPLDMVNEDQRGHGKTLNFQTIYGATKWGVARKMEIPLHKAEEFISKFFGKYRQLAAFKRAVEDTVLREMYSTTLLGRKRYFSLDKGKLYNTGTFEYEKAVASIAREGFNHPIQGSSADMLKRALINMYNNNPFGRKFRMLMVIHDEVVVEADEDIAEEAREFIIKTMNKAGNDMMNYIEAKTDSHIENYWSKS